MENERLIFDMFLGVTSLVGALLAWRALYTIQDVLNIVAQFNSGRIDDHNDILTVLARHETLIASNGAKTRELIQLEAAQIKEDVVQDTHGLLVRMDETQHSGITRRERRCYNCAHRKGDRREYPCNKCSLAHGFIPERYHLYWEPAKE